MTITRGLAKRLRAVLEDVRDGARADEVEALFLLQKLEPRKAPKKTWAKRKPEPSRAEVVSPLLEAARARANGFCESCELMRGPSLFMDHWLGGNGRRRVEERLETVWMVCVDCNHNRTYNIPSAEYWNAKFAGHCERYGYPFVPHIEHQALPGRSA